MTIIKYATLLASCFLASATYSHAVLISEWNSANSGSSSESSAVEAAINAFNRNNPGALIPLFDSVVQCAEQVGPAGFVAEGTDNKVFSWTAPSDHAFVYVLTKWGQGQAWFDTALHFLVAGEQLVYDPIDHLLDGKKGKEGAPNGLSHVSVWCGPSQQVPDTSSTLALLALGLASLGLIARRRKA